MIRINMAELIRQAQAQPDEDKAPRLRSEFHYNDDDICITNLATRLVPVLHEFCNDDRMIHLIREHDNLTCAKAIDAAYDLLQSMAQVRYRAARLLEPEGSERVLEQLQYREKCRLSHEIVKGQVRDIEAKMALAASVKA